MCPAPRIIPEVATVSGLHGNFSVHVAFGKSDRYIAEHDTCPTEVDRFGVSGGERMR